MPGGRCWTTIHNFGVEVTRGNATSGAVEAILRDGREDFVAPVRDGVYWLVRWHVPDPDDADGSGVELVAFRHPTVALLDAQAAVGNLCSHSAAISLAANSA
jgi:hypothetical protein